MKKARCKHCGDTEERHCPGYEPRLTLPSGCVCDPEEWVKAPVPAACAAYVGPGYCSTCEHDEECHR